MSSSRAWRALGLDLVSLRLFVATAEEQSLAKAAAREHIAVSAVSRRISDLEERTGVQLFERRDRGVELTAAGAQLLGQVRDIFQLLERVALDLEALRGGVRGHVRIQAHMSTALLGLPRLVADFLAANPGVEVELEELTSFDVIHSVRTGMTDVGFVSGTVQADGVELIPWESDELVAVLPPSHPLAARDRLTLGEMLAHPFVMMQRDSALLAVAQEQARLGGGALRVRAHAASFESARAMIAAGLGVAILPAQAIGPFAAALGLEVRPLAESWARRELMICVRDPARLSAAARLFLRHLVPGAAA
jgi:DNA-binding transcriptional LysR family regulator